MKFEKEYFKDRKPKLEPKHLMEVINFIKWAGLKKGDKVFVHGCGYGRRLHWFLKHGMEAVGYEISKYAKEHAFGLAKGNILDYFPDKKFDLLISYDVLEHIPESVLVEDMKILSSLSDRAIYYITDKHSHNYPKDDTHVNPKSIDEWIEFLKIYYKMVKHKFYYFCGK